MTAMLNGIPVKSGINDCWWNKGGKCLNFAVTQNKHILIRNPGKYARDWDSKQNCVYTIQGTALCFCFESASNAQYKRRRYKKMMENDLLHFAMIRAAQIFNGDNHQSQINGLVFNLACLSKILQEFAGLKDCIDGCLLRILLVGRTDVDILSGGSHYRLRT